LRTVWEAAHWKTDNGFRRAISDIDGDGKSGPRDWALFSGSYGKTVGDINYDWRSDFDGSGKVGTYDWVLFSIGYGENASRVDGARSWYADGGDYSMWQWLNSSIDLIKVKQINFSFNFLPEYIYVNETEIQVRAESFYTNSTGEYWVNGTWFHPTSNTTWYKLSVATNIPNNITAIKVVIHGKPDFEAWIDLASLDIT
jgi:hypothetical protein